MNLFIIFFSVFLSLFALIVPIQFFTDNTEEYKSFVFFKDTLLFRMDSKKLKGQQTYSVILKSFLSSLILGILLLTVLIRTLKMRHGFHQSNMYKSTRNIRYMQSSNLTTTWYKVGALHSSTEDFEWRKKGILYEIPAYGISILSAIGRNRSFHSGWDEIILNGWEGRTYVNYDFDCCIYYKTGQMAQAPVLYKNHWLQCKYVDYLATQYTCRNPGRLNGSNPVGISLGSPYRSCNEQNKHFMPVTYPQKQPSDSISLCAKIAYGSISSERLIEWYEIQKYFGVNKVVTFIFNLTSSALAVLQHYQKQGYVELLPYQFPREDAPKRTVGDKTAQVFNDEQVVVFDCAERLAGYQYVGLLDHDEFIIPTPTYIKKLTDIFKIFLGRKPNASGFRFMTELFITDWGKTNNSNNIFVTQFLNRTEPMLDRQKNVYMPERVIPGTVWTHSYTSRPSYEMYMVSSDLAALKHFRSCRKEWIERHNCFTRLRYTDTKMVEIVERINRTLQNVRQLLLSNI